MSNLILLSIVIPVYNTEKYLAQCVNSVIEQPYEHLEVILVDDGSTDNSGKLCDEFEQKDNRIKVIHKENGGLSSARNTGIKHITGDYVLFVDSDDFIEKNSILMIVEFLKNYSTPDVVFLEAYKFYEKNNIEIPLGDGYKSDKINGRQKKEVMAHLACIKKYPSSSCTKLIKASLFSEHNLFFIENTTSEDIEWVTRLLNVSLSFLYYEGKYYYYRQNREGSITNTYTERKFCDLFNVINIVIENMKDNEFKDTYYSFMAFFYPILLMHYSNLKDKKQYYKQVKELQYILDFKKNKRTTIVKICCKILGVNFTAKLLNLHMNIRNKNY